MFLYCAKYNSLLYNAFIINETLFRYILLDNAGNLGQLFLCLYLTSLVVFVLDFLNELHNFLTDVLKDDVDYAAPAKWRQVQVAQWMPLCRNALFCLIEPLLCLFCLQIHGSTCAGIFFLRAECIGTCGGLHPIICKDNFKLQIRHYTEPSLLWFSKAAAKQ